MAKEKFKWVRYIYLYLVTAIAIVMIIIASVGFIKLILEEYVFDVKGYEEFGAFYECGETDQYAPKPAEVVVDRTNGTTTEEIVLTPEELEACKMEVKARREAQHLNDIKRDLVNWIAMLLVAVPVYLYHWGVIRKEGKKK